MGTLGLLAQVSSFVFEAPHLPQSGTQWLMIAGHAVIGDRTLSGAQAGIAGSIRKGHVTVQGSPAIDAKVFARASAVYKQLPEIYRDFYTMKDELEALKASCKTKR